MTIFDYIKDIVVRKKGDLSLDSYSPFMVNRWLSFINPTVTECINALNSKTLLENKELHYKTAICLFPKFSSCPRIRYVKKVKENIKENEELNKQEACLSEFYEMSRREISYLRQEIENLS